ncbi:hypothetical protein [Rhodococcus sp. IEGM 1408]|uniref:hypothetical protein n=1 Tax=Rhodococcus sp. IEGM 1408 TaxID=3082220 RepID=UPI002953E10C|nr:hypothetical protein [Rhodococcus sp. IEGM 1408]MDV8001336.1 hypothetical protein [Rhodococcus sp. IEGM 1408]
MRARLARPRRIVRGRLVAPVAAAAAVALVAGVVVSTPDAPTVRGDVQTVAVTAPAFNAGASYSFNLQGLLDTAAPGTAITGVTGLPEGLTYSNGTISGTTATSGMYTVQVSGTAGGRAVTVPVTLTVNDSNGTAPAGAEGGSTAAVEGSLGGAQAEAGGQVTTGSAGTDAILGAVVSIVTSVGGDAAADLVTGSLGTGEPAPGENLPENPTAPFGSDANGQLNLGSLGGGTPDSNLPDGNTPDTTTPDTGSLGLPGSTTTAGGDATGETTGGFDTQSLGPLAPLGSLLDTGGQTGSTTEGDTTTGGTTTGANLTGDLTGGGEITIPGSTTATDTGSLGNLAPGLALTGAALLGLAGLSLVLNGGSSTPGSTSLLPALPGSTSTGGGTTGGGSLDSTSTGGDTNGGGSTGSTAPTVAAGAPSTVQAPGPTVANGRG